MIKINIMALRHSAFYSPLLMTIAGKFLQDEGLEPKYSVATPDNTVPDSIHNGACHVAQSVVATSFAELEQGGSVDISTIQAYKDLGCWEPGPLISKMVYEKLLDVFLLSGEISRRHPYDKAIVQPPSIA